MDLGQAEPLWSEVTHKHCSWLKHTAKVTHLAFRAKQSLRWSMLGPTPTFPSRHRDMWRGQLMNSEGTVSSLQLLISTSASRERRTVLQDSYLIMNPNCRIPKMKSTSSPRCTRTPFNLRILLPHFNTASWAWKTYFHSAWGKNIRLRQNAYIWGKKSSSFKSIQPIYIQDKYLKKLYTSFSGSQG